VIGKYKIFYKKNRLYKTENFELNKERNYLFLRNIKKYNLNENITNDVLYKVDGRVSKETIYDYESVNNFV
jgi:hypothetical protein